MHANPQMSRRDLSFCGGSWSKMNLLFRILVEKKIINTKNYMISKHIIAHFYYFYVPEER